MMLLNAAIIANLALISPFLTFASLLPNDSCNNATIIRDRMLPFFDSRNSSLATNNKSDPLLTCTLTIDGEKANDGNTFWYRYHSDSEGVLIVDSTESITLPVIGLYMGTTCRNLVEVICAEEEYIMYYPVARNRTYYLKVGEYSDGIFGSDIISLRISKESSYFSVIDANTDQTYSLLYDLYNGGYVFEAQSTIDYSRIRTSSISIEAKFHNTTAAVRSVRLTLDSKPATSICEVVAPFTLFGKDGANIRGSPLDLGSRVITATAYNGTSCNGRVLGQMTQNFLVRGCADSYFSLYDSTTKKFKQTISNGTVVTNPPCSANIGYTFQCGFTAKVVRFEVRTIAGNILVASRTDRVAPYFLFGTSEAAIDVVPHGVLLPGDYRITPYIDGIAHAHVQFTVSGICSIPQGDSSFGIDLRFAGNESPISTPFTFEEAKMFVPIVNRISSLIIGDKPDIINTTDLGTDYFCGAYPPLIDDLFVCVGLYEYENDNDEILGVMLGGFARESDNLPFTSTIMLDKKNFYKMKAAGTASDYILQHLIQTLGGSQLWSEKGLANSTAPCNYSGSKAKAEFQKITNCSAPIPLEQNSMPSIPDYNVFDCIFWDPNCLKNEVLTFTMGKKKISRITLGSLEDVGYKVNYTNADTYTIADIGVCAGCRKRREVVETPPLPSCYVGPVFEKAVAKGKKILATMRNHSAGLKLPPGVVYFGDQQILVAYQHESGLTCSVVVTPSGHSF